LEVTLLPTGDVEDVWDVKDVELGLAEEFHISKNFLCNSVDVRVIKMNRAVSGPSSSG
jgi:hypothetical protein